MTLKTSNTPSQTNREHVQGKHKKSAASIFSNILKDKPPNYVSSKTIENLESKIFKLETQILALKKRTETLEDQNKNLVTQLKSLHEEKVGYQKLNEESQKKIQDLEHLSKRNEESINLMR